MRFGINITQEFCERPDVIERKEKLETAYRERLNEDWRVLINAYPEKDKLGEEAVEDFFDLGINATLCELPSDMITTISSFTEQMIFDFIVIIVSIFVFTSSCFLQLNFPDLQLFGTYQIKGITGFLLIISMIFFYRSGKNMKNVIPRIIELRRQFFELSESAKLEELLELYDELDDRKIL